MNQLSTQIKLLIAEKLMLIAFRIMPNESDEKLKFAEFLKKYELTI